jgi:hypothetical protein
MEYFKDEDLKRSMKYIFQPLEKCKACFEKFYKQSSSIWEWS